MDKETRLEIVLHGVRWAQNILTEVLSNHASAVSKEGRDALAEAVSKLAESDGFFRGFKK